MEEYEKFKELFLKKDESFDFIEKIIGLISEINIKNTNKTINNQDNTKDNTKDNIKDNAKDDIIIDSDDDTEDEKLNKKQRININNIKELDLTSASESSESSQDSSDDSSDSSSDYSSEESCHLDKSKSYWLDNEINRKEIDGNILKYNNDTESIHFEETKIDNFININRKKLLFKSHSCSSFDEFIFKTSRDILDPFSRSNLSNEKKREFNSTNKNNEIIEECTIIYRQDGIINNNSCIATDLKENSCIATDLTESDNNMQEIEEKRQEDQIDNDLFSDILNKNWDFEDNHIEDNHIESINVSDNLEYDSEFLKNKSIEANLKYELHKNHCEIFNYDCKRNESFIKINEEIEDIFKHETNKLNLWKDNIKNKLKELNENTLNDLNDEYNELQIIKDKFEHLNNEIYFMIKNKSFKETNENYDKYLELIKQRNDLLKIEQKFRKTIQFIKSKNTIESFGKLEFIKKQFIIKKSNQLKCLDEFNNDNRNFKQFLNYVKSNKMYEWHCLNRNTLEQEIILQEYNNFNPFLTNQQNAKKLLPFQDYYILLESGKLYLLDQDKTIELFLKESKDIIDIDVYDNFVMISTDDSFVLLNDSFEIRETIKSNHISSNFKFKCTEIDILNNSFNNENNYQLLIQILSLCDNTYKIYKYNGKQWEYVNQESENRVELLGFDDINNECYAFHKEDNIIELFVNDKTLQIPFPHPISAIFLEENCFHFFHELEEIAWIGAPRKNRRNHYDSIISTELDKNPKIIYSSPSFFIWRTEKDI